MTLTSERCYRHRPDIVKKRHETPFDLSLDHLSSVDSASIEHIWSLFAASPQKQRQLVLQGILTLCCMPQLSFIHESLQPLLRIDFVMVLPRHVSLQIFSYLDAISLCRVAQVSRSWSTLASDKQLWQGLCEQHIGKLCPRCGWGLSRTTSLRNSRRLPLLVPPTKKRKTSRTVSPFSNPPSTFHDPHPSSWKTLYRDRMLIEKNWRQHRYLELPITPLSPLQPDDTLTENGVICMASCHHLGVCMIGYHDRTVHILDLTYSSSTSSSPAAPQPHQILTMPATMTSLQFDESKLVVGHADHAITLWDWHQGIMIRRLVGHHGPITSLCHEKNLLATGASQTIRVWDFSTGQSFLLHGHQQPVRTLAVLPSSFLGLDHDVLAHSDPFSASLLAPPPAAKDPVIVSAGDDDGCIRVWKGSTCVRLLSGHQAAVEKILVVHPSTLLLDSPDFPPVQERHPPASNPGPPRVLLLSCSADHTLRLWDLTTGQCLRTMFGHMDHITCMASDGLRVVTGSKDCSLRVWSLATGQCLYSRQLDHAVNDVALSWTGLLLSINDTAHFWNYAHSTMAP
ncbi:WD40 repeat-like protein [Hesseltinella vesiculosa]|uniref:WD40 repeat-like protein n=1 Tax=Hesseltinella vesiculosa TaxID=101127 RepID=A0A1X2G7U3_9FUNG|nr:WD40 repeat-like protein [Hesseltinella vesiculosa]